MNTSDWIGFAGVTILLIAFLFNILNRLRVNSYTYIVLNLIGAGLACVASVLIHYTPFVVLEGTWTLVSFVSLLRLAAGQKTT